MMFIYSRANENNTTQLLTSTTYAQPVHKQRRIFFLTVIACVSSLTSSAVHAYNFDTVAAFAIPALTTHYLSNKRTVAHIRAKAQAMINDYEHKNIDLTTGDLRWAYDIIKSTDKELENRLWWNSAIKSALAGLCTAFVYNNFMYPGDKNVVHNHIHYYVAANSELPVA